MIKLGEWVELNTRDVNSLPPPFETLEVETVQGALFSTCPQYVLCSGIRNGVKSFEAHFAHDKVKTLPLHAIKRWRVRKMGVRA